MIKLFPRESETLVAVYDRPSALAKLGRGVQRNTAVGTPALAGWIKEDRFELTLRTRRHHLFMPVARGRIDATSNGCLIFLSYELLPATVVFLIFWSVILVLFGISLYIINRNFLFLIGSLATLLLIYLVAWANFKLHIKTIRKAVMQLLE